MTESVGFIGIGMMGYPMICQLIKSGYDVVAYDRGQESRTRAKNVGASLVSNCSEIGLHCKIIITMLQNSKEVSDVVLGENGILEGLHKDNVLIDMSTSYPPSTKEIAHELAQRGIPMLDAPVAGGVIGAKQGKLCIMVGGNKHVFQRCLPLLQTMGSQIFHMGDTASGHTMKIVSNYLAALSVAATGEAFSLAVKAGLDSKTVSEVLKVSSGRNYSTEFKFPKYVLSRKFNDGFRLELYVKDLNLLHELSDHFNIKMPIGEILKKVYERANELGYGKLDHTNLVRLIEEDAGVTITY